MALMGDCDGMLDRDRVDSLELPQYGDEESDDDYDKDGGEPVRFFTNELSCRGRLHRLLIRNPTSRIYSAIFDLVAKLVICILYVIRVCLDDPKLYACKGQRCTSTGTEDSDGSGFTSTDINWYVIVWVHRPLALWVLQVVLCLLTASKAVLYVVIVPKGRFWDQVWNKRFLLEMVCSLPLIVTIFYPVMLKDFFVPLFLNCWLARNALSRVMNDLHLTKQRFQTLSVTLNQQICFVAVTLVCIIFTTICGIQHIQRSSATRPLNMFEAVYFAIVTLSTVGYGDISPDIWLGQLFMLLMICVAFAFIPKQIEEIGSTWAQKKRTGGDYGKSRADQGQHVVVCATSFSSDIVMNFLNEFYEHPKLEEHTVILMSSEELDSDMLFILKDPKWTHRVVYIKGSPLKDIDLKRCRINSAESVFFLSDKNSTDQQKSDQHTILRSWAVKDFAPECKQYVQLFKATNKQHIRFAEHVVCEDEFKFALLANNCLYPGLSTLVTLILYTSRGKEGKLATDAWQKWYGHHSGNEIYHIQLCRSIFFSRFEGRSFAQASAEVHEKYGVCLIAILDSTNDELHLKLNPGPGYLLKGSDYCFYMSETKEEYCEVTMLLEDEPISAISDPHGLPMLSMTSHEEEEEEEEEEGIPEDATHGEKHNTPGGVKAQEASMSEGIFHLLGDIGQDNIMARPLPNSMPVGTKRIICHLHCDPRPLCCLQWGVDCEHCSFKNAGDPRWTNHLIIMSVDECSPAVYNFIIPLRSSFLSLGSLYPVILLVPSEPDNLFLETIAHFPLVFWMKGTLKSLDDLLRAGIHRAVHLVISNVSISPSCGSEERLEDAETVVMVQKITRLFPSVNILTEMKEDSNMRFMHFQAHDTYSQAISRLEKRLKEKTTSNLPYMFRLPFAAGQVFSSAMLDRLLYQTFVKGYLICFVRLLLGIDAQSRSGHLSCVHVNRTMMAQTPTYGDLYQWLCNRTGEIPIGLYRTERRPGFNSEAQRSVILGNNNSLSIQKGRASIGSALFQKVEDYGNVTAFINSRLKGLRLEDEGQYVLRKPPRTLSYAIVNPSPKRKLKNGDMIYVLQPSALQADPRKPDSGVPAFSMSSQSLSHMFDDVSQCSRDTRCVRTPSFVKWNLDSETEEGAEHGADHTSSGNTTSSNNSVKPPKVIRWSLGRSGQEEEVLEGEALVRLRELHEQMGENAEEGEEMRGNGDMREDREGEIRENGEVLREIKVRETRENEEGEKKENGDEEKIENGVGESREEEVREIGEKVSSSTENEPHEEQMIPCNKRSQVVKKSAEQFSSENEAHEKQMCRHAEADLLVPHTLPQKERVWKEGLAPTTIPPPLLPSHSPSPCPQTGANPNTPKPPGTTPVQSKDPAVAAEITTVYALTSPPHPSPQRPPRMEGELNTSEPEKETLVQNNSQNEQRRGSAGFEPTTSSRPSSGISQDLNTVKHAGKGHQQKGIQQENNPKHEQPTPSRSLAKVSMDLGTEALMGTVHLLEESHHLQEDSKELHQQQEDGSGGLELLTSLKSSLKKKESLNETTQSKNEDTQGELEPSTCQKYSLKTKGALDEGTQLAEEGGIRGLEVSTSRKSSLKKKNRFLEDTTKPKNEDIVAGLEPSTCQKLSLKTRGSQDSGTPGQNVDVQQEEEHPPKSVSWATFPEESGASEA